ncbi:VOC family protein [Cellulomonas sp. ATA003]|uniref:VOC family protein n=1 Tax=Cellulomonas sp. ATA003 TaxID=3073064 RepID=UPI00287358C3|nr:VOC family protein [Cellulomonas sp. ATA003]WNB87149.1 VOC family protein [Cellulomonas sp. ATA003]
MANHLSPYIHLDGTAREAMELYRSVFGGELQMNTFGEFGAPEGVDPGGIMHAQLETPHGWILMASDLPPGMPHTPGGTITVCLHGDDADELRGFFARLADGGTVNVPLEKQMWGDEFGECVDRFGVGWLVNISGA